MNKEEKKKTTEVKAFARGIHMSPRKVRLVVDLLRKRPVADALGELQFVNKAATPPEKLTYAATGKNTLAERHARYRRILQSAEPPPSSR